MKSMKKLLAIALVLVMLTGLAITASAASITVEGAYENETYDAYKLLEYTVSEDGKAFSYYLLNADYQSALGTALKAAGFEFTQSADKTQWFVSNSEDLEGKGEDIAASLYESLDDWKDAALDSASATGTADKTAVFENDLEPGYWFVTSSLGSLCTLQSYDDQELVVEKNEMITPPAKEASDTEYQVGDTISYTITYTDVKGTNNELTIEDTMTAGLTYKASTLKVTINGTETTEGWTATPTSDADGATLTIVVDADVMDELEEGQTIVITYDCVVNNKASLDGTEKNTVVGRTSEQETTPTIVTIESFDVTINKTDGTDALKGAQFEIYRDDEDCEGDPLKLVAVSDEDLEAAEIDKAQDTVYYKVDPTSSNTTIDMTDASSAVVFGLDKDSTYYVLEIVAPEGYNLKEDPTEVAGGTASIDVVNNAGSELPDTGGIGTTLFYVIGSVLFLGAAVVLVTKRRVHE